MKKLFLFIFLLCATGLLAQPVDKEKFKSDFKAPDIDLVNPGQQTDRAVTPAATVKKSALPILKDTRFVNPIEIGEAGNAFGFLYNSTANIWINNDLNSVSFVHRMLNPPGTGYLSYDASFDGGNTWALNNQVYDPTLPDAYNARYPQGGIYNPQGNTNPDNAYFTWFAPTLDNSNASGDNTWGGYTWGASSFAEGSIPSQVNLASTPDQMQLIPDAFTITQLGDAWMVDAEHVDENGEYVYTGEIIVGHGMWNLGTENFDYTFEKLPLEIDPDEGINDIKIAFSPDGMTGYICVMSDIENQLPYTSYHPMLFKTTDGGESWSSDPMHVHLGGEDGIEAVKNFITDEMLEFHYDPDPVPPRDEIFYYMGYHVDLSVDAWGNPHIVGIVAIAEADGWYHYEGVFGMFHIWSDDQGETFDAFNLMNLKTFDAEYTSATSGSTVSMYNRPQASTTHDGAIVFFSWLDTHFEDLTDNSQPDIFFREYLPSEGEHGEEAIRVTEFSAAMWNARWGAMPHYVFTEVTESNYYVNIPWIYQELTQLDVGLPVQFWYIPDFERNYVITGLDEGDGNPVVGLAQNFPNPFSGTTTFNINLLRGSEVSIEVFNLTGQRVKHFDFGYLPNGPHQMRLNLEDLTSGVYFYSVVTGNLRQTGKMVAQ